MTGPDFVDPERVELVVEEVDEDERILSVRESYPSSAGAEAVAERYAEWLGETAEATVEEDDEGRPTVVATADADDLDAQIVAANVAVGLATRTIDDAALEQVAGTPRGYY